MKIQRISLVVIFSIFFFSACEEAFDLFTDNSRDAFTGDWKVQENNTLKSVSYYNVTIQKSSSDSTKVYIKNFYELGFSSSVTATVDGGRIRVPYQDVDGFIFQGSGDIAVNDKSIDWVYTVDHGNGTVDEVTAVYTRGD